MRIAMLARNKNLYSHKRLVEAAEQRGHDIRIIDTLRVYMNITAHKPDVRYKGEVLPRFDAVIPRIGASVTFYGLAVLRQFEMMGTWPLNAYANEPKAAEEIIRAVKGPPLVIKLLEGTQGIGVVLGETHSSAKSVIEAFRGVKSNILVQEFVKESKGVDIRCLVIGNKVVAAMMRQGAEGDFRSNLHRGGNASIVKITPEERSTAIRAAKTLGLNVAGVDLLRSNHGPVVMEVNSSPGLEGIENATGKDIAGQIIEFLETHAKPGKTKTRGRG